MATGDVTECPTCGHAHDLETVRRALDDGEASPCDLRWALDEVTRLRARVETLEIALEVERAPRWLS